MPSLARRTLTQINRMAGTLVLVALNFAVWFSIYVRADCCDAKLALLTDRIERCPLLSVTRKTFARAEFFRV